MRNLVVHPALAAVLMLAAAQVHGEGSQTVHRCVGRQGEIVFSGLPCTATEAAVSAMTAPDAPAPVADATCPATRAELRERIAGAVARSDANALAALMRWRGVGSRAAAERLRAMRELVARPLLAIDAGGDEMQTSDTPERSGDVLRVRTGSNETDGVRAHTFGVDVAGGCHWLAW